MRQCAPLPARARPVPPQTPACSSERRAIRRAFDQAAHRYDAAAALQRQIADRLWQAAAGILERTGAGWMLDAGCGTGYALRALNARRQHAIALDFSPAMLDRCPPGPAVCADIEALPLATASVAAYWSSLAWQWTDARRAMREAARVLRPGGTLHVATLGPDTLHEVRTAFAEVDRARHVRDFSAPECYGPWLAESGFASISVRREAFTAWLPDVRSVFDTLRGLGAHHVGAQARRTLLGRQAWQAVQDRYEQWRTPLGLPCTYDALFLSAVRP